MQSIDAKHVQLIRCFWISLTSGLVDSTYALIALFLQYEPYMYRRDMSKDNFFLEIGNSIQELKRELSALYKRGEYSTLDQ